MMRKAFTLMEINLAILIMAGGILSILGLYSLGFRENRQSAEDVASAAYADAVISPLVMALSATNVAWSTFRALENLPPKDGTREGWATYLSDDGFVKEDPTSRAQSAYQALAGKLGDLIQNKSLPSPPGTASEKLLPGLVIRHEPDSAVVKIGFRATAKKGLLLAAPLYYTEVRFQGDMTR